jgi:hypothetical protein
MCGPGPGGWASAPPPDPLVVVVLVVLLVVVATVEVVVAMVVVVVLVAPPLPPLPPAPPVLPFTTVVVHAAARMGIKKTRDRVGVMSGLRGQAYAGERLVPP